MNPNATSPIDASRTLAELATSLPSASRVFHRHALDFCCNGRRTVAEACAQKRLDADRLVAELRAADAAGAAAAAIDWTTRPLDELIDHVLGSYHEPHRDELRRLVAMAKKVEAVHADKPGCPHGLTALLTAVGEELEAHMQKEELVLFPAIRRGDGHHMAAAVRAMEQEHDDHGDNLTRLRQRTGDFTPPREACNTWRALYLGLAELELELMRHIHLENHVLFPRAVR